MIHRILYWLMFFLNKLLGVQTQFTQAQILPSLTIYYILLSGNPGLIGYYEIFMKSLYDTLQHDYVVWGLGHGGHDFHSSCVTLPSIRGIT